jgi:DNA cross-link repair 1A protein
MGASARTQRPSNTPKKSGGYGGGLSKKPSKPNASILSFFKKTEKPEDSLFVGSSASLETIAHDQEEDDLYGDEDRYNEVLSSVKKRRVSPEPASPDQSGTGQVLDTSSYKASPKEPASKRNKPSVRAPFILDSDSENDDDDSHEAPSQALAPPVKRERSPPTHRPLEINFEPKHEPEEPHEPPPDIPKPLQLKREESSNAVFQDDDMMEEEYNDEDLDLFEGEELREMRFMREQARLEAAEIEGFSSEDYIDDSIDDGTTATSCPICNGNMTGLSSNDATRHVNSCLDGDPTPLPKIQAALPRSDQNEGSVESEQLSKRFQPKSIPKPPQMNPFESASTRQGSVSAFSKLMSSNVEDSAWATAAASEKASRGRPAYERTCPFYKIMPGFSICVDAFRYNAIEGCKAYFLSHFHSDHYIGLTARWSHGPIYCSKVTGSLVRRQLGTAEKWVVELEFDKEYDVPGTDGATVTMIPANHCPGSSLFLFQKTMGKGANSHVKRILHCGDFRACPDHIRHPLLKPEVRDAVSGKVKQQKIDICYLDTTYLNPRYSFPPQEDVIRASAELCSNISPDPNSEDTILETDTPDVSKYFHKDTKKSSKENSESKGKPQQRLLVICGTYSIGKERICLAIAKALNSKIFASPSKIKICKQLDMPELTERLTSNPYEAQVHMQMLMEIRAETLQEYLNSYKPHFSRIVGFRPSGWNFRPVNGKSIPANTPPSSIATQQILHSKGWRTRFGHRDFTPQRGSTKEAMCFGVPYSEHSSFRELAMFVMGLRIEKIVPTVNVGSEQSRTRMKAWNDRWMSERRKYGLVSPLVEGEDEDSNEIELWDGKPSKGGSAWW